MPKAATTDSSKSRSYFGRVTAKRLAEGLPHIPKKLNYNNRHRQACTCPICKARKRGEETNARSARTAQLLLAADTKEAAMEQIDASDPDKVIIVKDRSPKNRVAEWVVLRAQGLSNKEIAQHLNIHPTTLIANIKKAAKEGWLKLDSTADRMKYIISPKIVDGIEYYVDARDRTMLIEAAKGTGIFQSHQAIRTEGQPATTMLALKIEMTGEQVKGGNRIFGSPKVIDARTIERHEES